MDRLVKPEAKEVEVIFQKGQKCSTSFKLTNLMHAMSVAVSLTTTNPSSAFTIDLPFSIIPPLSSSTYTLTLSHPSDHPPLFAAAPDAVTVRTSMLLAGKPHHHDDLRRLFSKPGPHIFKDAVIPMSMVGPHVAEFLISHHTQIPQSCSLLKKALRGFVSSELTNLLRFAVDLGNADSVAVLIDAGADANFKDSNGKSLVPFAIRAGKIDVVNVLLASGCRVDHSVDFVLHEAAATNNVDLMEFLLESFGVSDVNSVDFDGKTPIHVAALHGHAKMIRFCVSKGGNTNVVDCKGWTPLHRAASKGHLKAVTCLLECSNSKYVVDKDGKTAFLVAVDNGHLHLEHLLRWDDVLFRAARVDDVHGMVSCLKDGAVVNMRDQNGWTPLNWAAFKGRIKSVKLLLEHGAEVDAVDDGGYTPLRCAAEAGHLQVALLLIAYGSKANLKSPKVRCVVAPLKLDYFGKHLSLEYPMYQERGRA